MTYIKHYDFKINKKDEDKDKDELCSKIELSFGKILFTEIMDTVVAQVDLKGKYNNQ